MKRKLIIDCDPGQDDCINLFLALPHTDLYDILGITVVAGNVSLKKVSRNARMICEMSNRFDIPVYEGCDSPFDVPLVTAEEVHSDEGLEGIEVFEPEIKAQDKHAVDFIIDTLMAAESGEITLIPTGPLTNIASAIEKEPLIIDKISEIVMMGGALREGGNVTPSAEFNIFVDPKAAQIVFSSKCKITVFGLDVTHQVLSSVEVLERIGSIENKVAQSAYNLLTCYGRYDAEKYGNDGAPLHDPCTMAYILKPDLFEFKQCNVRVEVQSELTRGHTSVDFWNSTSLPRNSFWAHKVDADGFFDLLVDQLLKY